MRWQAGASAAAFSIAAMMNAVCWADGLAPPAEPRYEVYTGSDYNGRSADLTSSLVWGAFGPVTQPGFLVKFDALGDLYGETTATLFSKGFLLTDIKSLDALMVGYQTNYGPAWIKLYAGAAYLVQERIFYYAGSVMQQKDWGAALAFQSYWPFANRVSLSVNVTWMQPNAATWVNTRALYELYRTSGGTKVSVGGEGNLSLAGENTFSEGRAYVAYKQYLRGGGVLDLQFQSSNFSLSGGVSQASDEAAARPYVSLSFGRRF
jgi:hypothetical protein